MPVLFRFVKLQLVEQAMSCITQLYELARSCYARANATLNAQAKKTLQDMADQYLNEADDLRRRQITQAAFPKDNKI